jgi:hypothetical protein
MNPTRLDFKFLLQTKKETRTELNLYGLVLVMGMFVARFRRHTMRGRLWEVTMVPDDFRSTDTVRFPASLDGLRKHFLDITRVLDTTDIDFRCHGIRGAEMDAADTAQTLIEVLLECDVPDAVQLNFILAQVKAATLDDEFGLGQSVLREGQGQRKDGVAFSVSPENFLLVQVDAELAVFEGGHGMVPFVM